MSLNLGMALAAVAREKELLAEMELCALANMLPDEDGLAATAAGGRL